MKGITEGFMKDFVMESDLIEKIIFNQTKLLHDHPFNKNVGHFGAIKYTMNLSKRKISLQESDIKKIHELIMEEQEIYTWIRSESIGKYREFDIKKKSFLPSHYRRIPSMMKNFMKKIYEWQNSFGRHREEQNIEIIGRFHYIFEKIHPFVNGNGRVGRLIALYMILFADLEPFVFTSSDKEEDYFPAFQHRNKMASYFVKKYREQKERIRIRTEIKLPPLKSPRQEGNI